MGNRSGDGQATRDKSMSITPSSDDVDATGGQKVSLTSKLAGEDLDNNVHVVEHRYNYTRLTTGATTIKAAPGFLRGLLIGKAIASGTITLADSATAAATTPTILVPTWGASLADEGQRFIPFDCPFNTGLVITLSAGTWEVLALWR